MAVVIKKNTKEINFNIIIILSVCVCFIFSFGVWWVFSIGSTKQNTTNKTKPKMGMSHMFIGPIFILNRIPPSILGFSAVFHFRHRRKCQIIIVAYKIETTKMACGNTKETQWYWSESNTCNMFRVTASRHAAIYLKKKVQFSAGLCTLENSNLVKMSYI